MLTCPFCLLPCLRKWQRLLLAATLRSWESSLTLLFLAHLTCNPSKNHVHSAVKVNLDYSHPSHQPSLQHKSLIWLLSHTPARFCLCPRSCQNVPVKICQAGSSLFLCLLPSIGSTTHHINVKYQYHINVKTWSLCNDPWGLSDLDEFLDESPHPLGSSWHSSVYTVSQTH